MAKKKESEFEKLARLIKDESEDIRSELGDKIDSKIDKLERRMDERFTRIDRRLDETIQPQLDEHAHRIRVLETKTGRR